MNKQSILIVGASEHTKVIVDIFEKDERNNIIGYIDSYKKIGVENAGYKVLGNEENIEAIIDQNPGCKFFIAIGDNWIRKQIKDKLDILVKNIKYISAIHPSALIGKNVVIGEGVAIMAGVVVNPYSNIGDFSIINTRTSVDHDCNIGMFSSLAPGVTLGGKVKVGNHTAISIGAVISHGIKIGDHAIIGAGALLLNDCPNNTVMYGVPAEQIKIRNEGDKYL